MSVCTKWEMTTRSSSEKSVPKRSSMAWMICDSGAMALATGIRWSLRRYGSSCSKPRSSAIVPLVPSIRSEPVYRAP
jgi:hypothetical protein